MTNSVQRNRVPAGIGPRGGEFAEQVHSESDVSLDGSAETAFPHDETVTVGNHPERISAAEARRSLPEGQRVQVVYLNRLTDSDEPDVRTVAKQKSYQMVTRSVDDESSGGSLTWSDTRIDRDSGGGIIVSRNDRKWLARKPRP